MNIVKYTAKASATQVVGTTQWPSSTGFDVGSISQDWSSISYELVATGDPTATIDVTPQWSVDDLAWTSDTAFTQVTTDNVDTIKKPTLAARYLRFNVVVAAATSGAFSIIVSFNGAPGVLVP